MTRDQSIALHLAKVMGLSVHVSTDIRWPGRLIRNCDPDNLWSPQGIRHQCMEVMEWAEANGWTIVIGNGICSVAKSGSIPTSAPENSKDPIRAAICEAVALATGWGEKE